MSKKTSQILKQLLFLSIGVGLMWFVFQNMDVESFWESAKSMNYWFFLISAICAMTSHYFRALRWKLLINSIGYQPKTKNVFASVLFMYASNIAIPRSGEIARCGTLYKYEKIPVPQLLGTVVIERAIDLLTLLFFTGLLLVVQFEIFTNLYAQSSMPELVDKLINNQLLIYSVFGLTALIFLTLFLLRKQIFQFGPMQKVGKLLNDLKSSFIQVFKMKTKLIFLLHTIVIWVGYVGMFYICFFAYEPTSHLNLAAGLTAFVAGSFGMVAPTNGGIGAWHFMVILALTSLGLSAQEAGNWANVAFGIMTITVAAAGITAFFLLPYMNRNKKEEIIKA